EKARLGGLRPRRAIWDRPISYAMNCSHLGWREGTIEHIQFIDEPVLETASTKTGGQRQRHPIGAIFEERIADRLEFQRLAVAVQLNATRPTGTIVSDSQLQPLV